MKEKIAVVIVTYNRKELLLECLESVLSQTYPIAKIILIDNASTDGTQERLVQAGYLNQKDVKYIFMDDNTGGAGGFYEGIRECTKIDCDWVWVMDDDTIPQKDCLEKLIVAKNVILEKKILDGMQSVKKISFLASTVYGPAGEFMNLPMVSNKTAPNGYEYWYNFLEDGIVNISNATFVSLLINIDAIKNCGLPCRDYFIWGDDTEYTTRLTHFYGDAYFVGNSKVVHKRVGAKALGIDNEENIARIELFHFFYRNQVINNRYYNRDYHYIRQCIKGLITSLKYRKTHLGKYKARAIRRGYWEGLVQYQRFKSYIDDQLRKN